MRHCYSRMMNICLFAMNHSKLRSHPQVTWQAGGDELGSVAGEVGR